MIRLKFTGDMMCEIAQTAACQKGDAYDYSPIFSKVKKKLQDCDYLVGNFETPVAGEALEYSNARYSFNTPIEFAYAVKDAGFDLVSLANNHCMDRGVEGLRNTYENMKKVGLPTIGTDPLGKHAPFVHEIGEIKVGFVAWTYGTNAFFHHRYLPEGWENAVHLLQPEELTEGAIDLLDEAKIPARVEEIYGKKGEIFEKRIVPHLQMIRQDVEASRAAGAEYVIFIMHCGGQYNPMPDDYTKWIANYIRSTGVDAIVGHHPHILHPLDVSQACPLAYSLGNFSFLPKDENHPGYPFRGAYSAVLCLELEKGKGITKIDYELMKSVMLPNGGSQVVSVEELLQTADEAQKKVLMQDIAFCEQVLNTKLS